MDAPETATYHREMTWLLLAVIAQAQSEPTLGEAFVLHAGETSGIAETDLSVTFEEVRSDTRCPSDVQCIHAGEAEVVLALRTAERETSHVTVEVPPGGGATGSFRDYTIHVTALEPQTKSGKRIERHAYVVELRIDGAGSPPTSTKRSPGPI